MKIEIANISSIDEKIAELVRQKQEVLENNRAEYLDCVRDAVKTFNFSAEDVGIVAAKATRAKKGTGKKQITAKDRASRKLVTVCVPNTDETLQMYRNEDGTFTQTKRGKAPRAFESKIKDGTIGDWIVSEDAEALATSEPVTSDTDEKKTKKSSKK